MKIPGTKRFILKGLELVTTLGSRVWSIVYLPPKLGTRVHYTFLSPMGTRPICVNLMDDGLL